MVLLAAHIKKQIAVYKLFKNKVNAVISQRLFYQKSPVKDNSFCTSAKMCCIQIKHATNLMHSAMHNYAYATKNNLMKLIKIVI